MTFATIAARSFHGGAAVLPFLVGVLADYAAGEPRMSAVAGYGWVS
jgi:hypothetical protein